MNVDATAGEDNSVVGERRVVVDELGAELDHRGSRRPGAALDSMARGRHIGQIWMLIPACKMNGEGIIV